MSRTLRTVAYTEAGKLKRPEVSSRWRLEREERLIRTARDEKRIERAERATDRFEDEPTLPLGSTVRAVTL